MVSERDCNFNPPFQLIDPLLWFSFPQFSPLPISFFLSFYFPLPLLNLPLNTFLSFLSKIYAVQQSEAKKKILDFLLLTLTSLATQIPTYPWLFHTKPAQLSYSGQSQGLHIYSCCISSPATQIKYPNVSRYFAILFLWHKILLTQLAIQKSDMDKKC